jgi:hypothetical protein
LNLIERLWKFANEKVINLKYYPDFNRFKENSNYLDPPKKNLVFH